ncbi:type II toxin-antitoxin system Phd/YefM family antitoxin [Phaeobacter marinintestinus]|uniref:type II toxin-antitoxin system Phd/YefM family antitoxin n=1 Tax=Falsiphaeobacter marinintestinus TaxID=1492905 RepID=UPI0011B656CE|nr:type II toxin-antitoxin system Phd/YefM family antitoxin [Phaeobacter marinintestinus]
MRISVSEARARLGQLCAQAQDPRQIIILTRHGRDLAAIVSLEEVQRIWRLQEEQWFGRRLPWSGKRRGSVVLPMGLTPGPDGRLVSTHEAAEQVREIQMTRVEERQMLEAGGLEPVEGGEIGERVAPQWIKWILGWFG